MDMRRVNYIYFIVYVYLSIQFNEIGAIKAMIYSMNATESDYGWEDDPINAYQRANHFIDDIIEVMISKYGAELDPIKIPNQVTNFDRAVGYFRIRGEILYII